MFHIKLVLRLCLLGGLSFISPAYADGCTITIPTDIPTFEPVLLASLDGTSPYQLFKPTGQTTTLPIGAKLLLVCAGNGNIIKSRKDDSLELSCRTGNVFKTAGGQTFALSQLGCKSIPTSVLQLTSIPCADDSGYIFKAGFVFNTNQFAPVFSICYDNVTENTFYTHNIINGAAINYNIQESTRRAFRADGMKFTTTATNTFYTTNNQIARFERYFGPNQAYISSNSMYMARGHLTPDADFVFGYEQLSTYYYANAAPEFQVVNAGNWIRVENLARKLAAQYADDLEIYNGYMGILELPNTSSTDLVPIYVDNKEQIEAPQYYFKVIKHVATDAAIVMITLNNPFATAADIDEFCNNVCDRAGVNSPFFTDPTRGYTFCCELADFKKNYADLPYDLTATYLLNEANDDVEEPPVVSGNEPADDGCTITMPTDIPNPEPVYVVKKTTSSTPKLFWPTGEVTTLPIGSKLTLYCPGSGNMLTTIKQQSLELTCQASNQFFSVEKSQAYQLTQLNCKSIPTSDLLKTSTKCSNNQGYVFEAGFTLNTGFQSVFTICYNNETETTLYSRNIINGATQNYKINESTRRAFRAEGMRFTTTATNNLYTINQQIKRFQRYFGAQQNYIQNNNNYLARGHLAPDADFIFGYEQLTTYFYTNAAPEFQVVNAGNWIRVENLARSLATKYGSDLLTFTTTLGVLQLPTTKNVMKSIYLDDGELIKTPQYYYKVLIHPEMETPLVMITMNNPFADSTDVNEFCTNVCELYGVDSPFFTDRTRGYTFCCTLADFKNSVTGLPTFDLPAGWSA